MHVGRAAHHLDRVIAGVDPAHAEALRVRVSPHLGDHGDAERRQIGAARRHRLDLEAEHGQPLDDLRERCLGREVLLQPGQRELHRDSPP
jgi:hypothetical protein